MRLRHYQAGELIGIALILGSVATQMFYLDPLKREIEWRLVAFSVQQTGQVQTATAYRNQIAVLNTLNAPAEVIKAVEADRDKTIATFQTGDANVSNYLLEKQNVEGLFEWLVIGLFGLGSLLTGLGRAMEMASVPKD